MAQVDDLVAKVREAQLPPPSRRRRIRTQAHVTRRQVAEILGVTEMSIWNWEQEGSPGPHDLDLAIKYRKFLEELAQAVSA